MSDEFTQNENVTQPQDNPYQPQDYSQPQDNPGEQSYSQPQDNPYQSQTYSNPYQGQTYSNPYQGSSYGSPQGNNYQQYGNHPYYGQASQKKDGAGFGIASLVLGVLSIFLFACCVNYITAILAIVFGILQLVKSDSKGMAIAGIITASLSILIATLLWIGLANSEENGTLRDFIDRYSDHKYHFDDENGNDFDFDLDLENEDLYDELYDQFMEEYEKNKDGI